jgi:hypothetical protein
MKQSTSGNNSVMSPIVFARTLEHPQFACNCRRRFPAGQNLPDLRDTHTPDLSAVAVESVSRVQSSGMLCRVYWNFTDNITFHRNLEQEIALIVHRTDNDVTELHL